MADTAAEVIPNGTNVTVDENLKPQPVETGKLGLAAVVEVLKPCSNQAGNNTESLEGKLENLPSVTLEVAAAVDKGAVEGLKSGTEAKAVIKSDVENVGQARERPGEEATKGLVTVRVGVHDESKVEAMDIDDKNVDKRDQAKEEPEVEAVTPRKKGRPRKIQPQQKKPEPKMRTDIKQEESKKRPRQKKEPTTPTTPHSERDRPSRERKSIERFVATLEKDKKELVIQRGSGTLLMEIPNVAYKLSKRNKNDDILSMLHLLLFNKRAKANLLKYNIYRFSGYVWSENEEKERSKVKEKLERYTKEGLGQLIDVLDLHLPKTGKKEDLVVKIMEFLDSPHKTTEVLLEERDQKLKEKKRKSRTPGKGKGTPGRKRRKMEETPSGRKGRKKSKDSSDDERDDEVGRSDDESLEEEEEAQVKRLTFKEDDDEDYEVKRKPQKRPTKLPKEDKSQEDNPLNEEQEEQKVINEGPKKAFSPDISNSSKPTEKVYTKGSTRRGKELKEQEEKQKQKEKEKLEEQVPEKKKRRGRGKAKPKPQTPSKAASIGKAAKGNDTKKRKKNGGIPSDKVLQHEIFELIKDLSPEDFTKVTFMDIVVQLEKMFDVSLSQKKAHVKYLIRREVGRLAPEGDDEEDQGQVETGTNVAAKHTEVETEGNADVQANVIEAEESAGKALEVNPPHVEKAVAVAEPVDSAAKDQPETKASGHCGTGKSDQPEMMVSNQLEMKVSDLPETKIVDQPETMVTGKPDVKVLDQAETEVADQPQIKESDQPMTEKSNEDQTV